MAIPVIENIFVICICVFVCIGLSQCFTRLDLGHSQWIITRDSTGMTIPGKVPGTVYSALYHSNFIEDPLYRYNDVKYAWIGRENWTYSTVFEVPSVIAKAGGQLLVCEGLDTVASLLINDKDIGYTDNMFLRTVFDVQNYLVTGNNTITIKFASPVLEAAVRANKLNYPILPVCHPPEEHGECNINQLRKLQFAFGWDWGPSLPTMGIWKPIYIDGFNFSVIRDLTALTRKVNSTWLVDVEIYLDVVTRGPVVAWLSVSLEDLNVTYTENVTLTSDNSTILFTLNVPNTTNVLLWWPKGYGTQKLFNLTVNLTSGQDVTQKSVTIGFRTVELVQNPVSHNSSDGLSYYFKINGWPIFLKGSNWIPADSFQEEVTVDRLRFLLKSASSVNMNTLRMNGVGIYERDEFYQICNELGIMVWQDLMFSVAMYPAYSEYLASVSKEVKYEMRRLKHHPSIILWAGNNENEAALRGNWFGTDTNFSIYYDDYVKLYATTLMPIVQEEDSMRPYIMSSPSNGILSEQEGYVATDPLSELYGDIHYYDYAADLWNYSVLEIPRMITEYGTVAWCNYESLLNVFEPSDFNMSSDMVDHRQHHPNGNVELVAEVGQHLNFSRSTNDKQKFIDFIYLTQINQAMSGRTQTEHYRRYQSQVRPDGRGLTMGALYWQLNDIWQAPTWSSIDYEGSWKMLHYYAKSFLNKYLISPYFKDVDTLDVYIVVDEIPIVEVRNPVDGKLSFQPKLDFSDGSVSPTLARRVTEVISGTLLVEMFQYSSFQRLHSWTIPYKLNTTAESVLERNISDMMIDSACPGREECFLVFTAIDKFWSVLSTSWLLLTSPKHANLRQAHFVVTVVLQLGPSFFEIEFTSDAIALFVWLSVGNISGYFSDNGFVMLQGAEVVYFYAQSNVTEAELRSALTIRSLANI